MSKWDIPDNINFAYYESPIQRIIEDSHNRIIKEEEHQLMMRISQAVGFDVDKEELLKAMLYDRDQYAKGYEAGLNADRWISVKDQLPEEEGRYLAYIANEHDNELQYIMTADFFPYRAKWIPDDETASDNVIAWMELPKPYEERSGDEE